jgi:hypothetical protein
MTSKTNFEDQKVKIKDFDQFSRVPTPKSPQNADISLLVKSRDFLHRSPGPNFAQKLKYTPRGSLSMLNGSRTERFCHNNILNTSNWTHLGAKTVTQIGGKGVMGQGEGSGYSKYSRKTLGRFGVEKEMGISECNQNIEKLVGECEKLKERNFLLGRYVKEKDCEKEIMEGRIRGLMGGREEIDALVRKNKILEQENFGLKVQKLEAEKGHQDSGDWKKAWGDMLGEWGILQKGFLEQIVRARRDQEIFDCENTRKKLDYLEDKFKLVFYENKHYQKNFFKKSFNEVKVEAKLQEALRHFQSLRAQLAQKSESKFELDRMRLEFDSKQEQIDNFIRKNLELLRASSKQPGLGHYPASGHRQHFSLTERNSVNSSSQEKEFTLTNEIILLESENKRLLGLIKAKDSQLSKLTKCERDVGEEMNSVLEINEHLDLQHKTLQLNYQN